jgi:D-sedoheptulose 7-phosphate isomerase|tara:strand:- start:23863 stop:24444 length:582 start_codon:yes stop_codon:yes gene_type:complete
MEHINNYMHEVQDIALGIDRSSIQKMVSYLKDYKDRGRVFVLGVGGSAANASHMVNDLRKLCGIEAYAPTDNVSELSARTNDEGFETTFIEYLKVSRFNEYDCVFVLSVGGGSKEKNVSVNLINAIDYARKKDGVVLSIVGKLNGYAVRASNASVVVPYIKENRITPHSEAFQAVIWHCLVSHPELQINATKW